VRPLPSGVAEAEDLSSSAATWIRHALSICNARALNVSFHNRRHRLRLDSVPFVSRVLTRVVLTDVAFDSGGCLDFSRCPVLENLTMSLALFMSTRYSCPNVVSILRRAAALVLPHLTLFHWNCRSVASAKAPIIEKMPLLEAARVRLREDECGDICPMDCNGDSCEGCNGSGEGCSVLLEGLSGATHLDLTSHPRVVISLYLIEVQNSRLREVAARIRIFLPCRAFFLRVHLHVDVRYS
jgi:hypothetical protein